ncbi:hypothetical protein AAHB53_01625 [Niallia circulans]
MSESQVFEEEVINPIYEACYQDAEYFTETVKAPENREEVNNIIQTMDVKAINSAIEESLIKSSNYIPSNQKTNICIYPTEATKSTTLMFTEGAGKISVLYNELLMRKLLKQELLTNIIIVCGRKCTLIILTLIPYWIT